MSKKKAIDDELDNEILGKNDDDSELLENLRKEDKKIGTFLAETPSSKSDLDSTQDLAERLTLELAEPQRDFKYLKISIDQHNDIEYYVHVKHQSHGFMNYLVTKTLKCKGVDFAAYKNTSMEPPVLYIRVDGTKSIKNIIKEAIKLMRIDWKGMKNAVSSIKT